MSFIPTRDLSTRIKSSIIKAGTPSYASVGGRFSLSGSINGSSSIVSDRLRLLSGSSYYLEGSVLVRNNSRDGAITFQWYNTTSSSYIGSEGFMNFDNSFGSTARVSRRVACALVLDADISSSADIELRIKSRTGSTWSMTITSNGIDTFNYVGYPTARLLELTT